MDAFDRDNGGLPSPFGTAPGTAEGLRVGPDEFANAFGEPLARALGLHVGTVLGYLNRIRTRRPEVYADLVVLRGRQLGERHVGAIKRAMAHSAQWHRKQANRRYHARFGIWPWER